MHWWVVGLIVILALAMAINVFVIGPSLWVSGEWSQAEEESGEG